MGSSTRRRKTTTTIRSFDRMCCGTWEAVEGRDKQRAEEVFEYGNMFFWKPVIEVIDQKSSSPLYES
uniref:Ovule protein n=1 Tax=Caenorhabditis tropicalis TaxID=1561998 RepID=A0A1I7TXQ2_9PELO